MKKSYCIDITNDPLFEQLQSKQSARRPKKKQEIRVKTTPSVDIERIYDALNFQEDIDQPSTQTNNSLLKYIKKQEHDLVGEKQAKINIGFQGEFILAWRFAGYPS